MAIALPKCMNAFWQGVFFSIRKIASASSKLKRRVSPKTVGSATADRAFGCFKMVRNSGPYLLTLTKH